MIRLVPNTGIQFVKLAPIVLKDLVAHEFRARRGVSFGSLAELAPRRRPSPSVDDEEGDNNPAVSQLKPRAADMQLLDGLIRASGTGLWIPIPFDSGGLWAAIFLAKDATLGMISAVLAIDTTLESDGNPEGLAPDELGERIPAPCAPIFWRRDSTYQHARALAQALPTSAGTSPVDAIQMAIAGLADFLARAGTANVHLERRPENRSAIGVDVIIDLGNSRTCVLLREQGADGRRERLSLVYPDDPRVSAPSPFDTQSAFFEHEVLPRSVEGTFSFRFLSMIKMGRGALDALAQARQDVRPLGLSTPKRYLWEDAGAVPWEWRYANPKYNDRSTMSPPIRGEILRRMDTRRPFKSPAIPEIPVQPDYPRVACMVWAMVELLEQSFRQINSPEWRRASANAPYADKRRQIRNVVVTYPAGLHSVELKNLRKATERAARLWSEFRSSPEMFCTGATVDVDPQHGVPPPVVQLVCDEGLAIQVCWLYGEAMHRFQADPELLIGALGRRRGGVNTLRLASIDIGGGTIDLSISDYRADSKLPVGAAFICDQLFHDGISRAGDDVVRGILEEIVFPAIVRQAGVAIDKWNRVFASPSSTDDAIRELRLQLVRAVWMPIVMRCLAEFEASADVPVSFDIRSVCSETTIIEVLNQMTRDPKISASVKSIADVVIEADRTAMRSIVRNSIGKTLNQCADIVDQFECDLLVVGGRPSSNPAIRDQIYASMAVPPGQVFFLSEQAVDDWYPFADGTGRIGDAKTCGVVGGWLAFAARHGMGQFMITILDKPEPMPIIGYLKDANPSKLPTFSDKERLDLSAGSLGIPIMPMQPLTIACRRVDHPQAEARPIYRLSLKRQYMEALHKSPGFQREISVKFELLEPEPPLSRALGDRLEPPTLADVIQLREGGITGMIPRPRQDGGVDEVDAEGCMELTPRTMLENEGYWIDTGIFRPVDGAFR